MRTPLAAAVTVAAILAAFFAAADGLGSAATLAVSSGTVCGVLAGVSVSSIRCWSPQQMTNFSLFPAVSFSSVSSGQDFFCGLRSGGRDLLCWKTNASGNSSSSLPVKRVYKGTSVSGLSVGDHQIAAVEGNGTGILFWRGDHSFPREVVGVFQSLTSGRGYSCAIDGNNTVLCWGSRGGEFQSLFNSVSMSSIAAGDSHICGITTAGGLICRGSNDSGQLDSPKELPFQFGGLALGARHSCAIRQDIDAVLCWGGIGGNGTYAPAGNTTFEFIVAGGDLTCGVVSANLSVVCWTSNQNNLGVAVVPLPQILPGICVPEEKSCSCGANTLSQSLCSGRGFICKTCPHLATPSAPLPSPPSPPPPSRKRSKWNHAFLIVGIVGCVSGLCAIVYFIFTCVCRQKKVHNSVQPTIAAARNGTSYAGGGADAGAVSSPYTSPNGSRSSIFRRQASRAMRRQRSGPSSFKDRAEQFSLAALAAATKNFSAENKIGAGSFGTVYRGKLPDGREVAIKRSETSPRTKKFQEKESAFQSELAFLSRLNHKHLVGLVGYCEEKEERLLVYEYMKNGALYDHLHAKKNAVAVAATGGTRENPGMLNSWKMRIKVLLDASRGIEYLHNYAVPPIIHRDIKSSNILLDASWTARVSDFGLSLMGPATEGEHLSMKAAGTVGYMDPEYYGLHHLTVKSDVYGFGVVMLEVLTGKRAIFKDVDCGSPVSVVDYALSSIAAGEVARVLDARVDPPSAKEMEAVELLAYTAVHCVSLEGRERPTMTDIILNLESALAMCDGSHASNSSASIRSSN